MKHIMLIAFSALLSVTAGATTTLPLKGNVVKPTDKNIQYVGRICFDNPERPRFTFPGTQINARFTGTSLKMLAKPHSGYFMAQIDDAEPFKVAFMGQRDSVVTLATALPQGDHTVRLMYIIEGYELKPSFWGFVLDSGARLLSPPALPQRTIEFIGNSITCGYGCPTDLSCPGSPCPCGGPQRYRRLSQLWRSEDGNAGERDDYRI